MYYLYVLNKLYFFKYPKVSDNKIPLSRPRKIEVETRVLKHNYHQI